MKVTWPWRERPCLCQVGMVTSRIVVVTLSLITVLALYIVWFRYIKRQNNTGPYHSADHPPICIRNL